MGSRNAGMIIFKLPISTVLVAVLGASSPAHAQIPNSANGHLYSLTPAPMPWADAEVLAEQQGGTLAAVTGAAEQQWVVNAFSPTGVFQVWLGGRDHEVGPWTWQSGEPFGYA